MKLPDKVVEGLVAGLFGLTGTLITAGLSWFRDRGVATQRIHQLEEATKRLQFWDQWVKVAAQLPQAADAVCMNKVQQEMVLLVRILERSSHSMEAEMAEQRTETDALRLKVQGLSIWRRWFLLYPPPRSLAWLPRIFFYLGVATICFILFALADPEKTASKTEVMVAEAVMLSGTMVFRFLSQLLEKPKINHGIGAAPPPVPVSQPLQTVQL